MDSEANSWIKEHLREPKELLRATLGLPYTLEFWILFAAFLCVLLVVITPLFLLPAFVLLAWVLLLSLGSPYVLTKQENGEIVGSIRLKKIGNRTSVAGIYVVPERRGKGISKSLLLEALEHSRHQKWFIAYTPSAKGSRYLIKKYLGSRKLRIGSPEYYSAIERLKPNS